MAIIFDLSTLIDCDEPPEYYNGKAFELTRYSTPHFRLSMIFS